MYLFFVHNGTREVVEVAHKISKKAPRHALFCHHDFWEAENPMPNCPKVVQGECQRSFGASAQVQKKSLAPVQALFAPVQTSSAPVQETFSALPYQRPNHLSHSPLTTLGQLEDLTLSMPAGVAILLSKFSTFVPWTCTGPKYCRKRAGAIGRTPCCAVFVDPTA